MGSSTNGKPFVYMGMGIILYRLDQHPAANANQFDHSTTHEPTHRTILGALVGVKTEEIINRGA